MSPANPKAVERVVKHLKDPTYWNQGVMIEVGVIEEAAEMLEELIQRPEAGKASQCAFMVYGMEHYGRPFRNALDYASELRFIQVWRNKHGWNGVPGWIESCLMHLIFKLDRIKEYFTWRKK
jgi:hypothetical protein